MQCNICGGTDFTDMPKRPKVRCADCGSLERTRLTALYVGRHVDLPPDAHILHFAPERGLAAMLGELGGMNYRALDIDPARYPGLVVERFDLCRDVYNLPLNTFDLIVHNHVLEHVECNYSAVLIRLARSLAETGTMLFSVPIVPGEFRDELIDASWEQKQVRFGPMVHVRRFGTDFLQQNARHDLSGARRLRPQEQRSGKRPRRGQHPTPPFGPRSREPRCFASGRGTSESDRPSGPGKAAKKNAPGREPFAPLFHRHPLVLADIAGLVAGDERLGIGVEHDHFA